jgi:long-chain acyl-CoA synthetase
LPGKGTELFKIDFSIFGRMSVFGEKILWWEGEWRTNRRLLDLSRAWSEKLASSGFARGDRLAIIMPNCPVFLALCLAVWENRGTVVTLNGAGGSRAVSQTLELADPHGIVISEIFPELVVI